MVVLADVLHGHVGVLGGHGVVLSCVRHIGNEDRSLVGGIGLDFVQVSGVQLGGKLEVVDLLLLAGADELG